MCVCLETNSIPPHVLAISAHDALKGTSSSSRSETRLATNIVRSGDAGITPQIEVFLTTLAPSKGSHGRTLRIQNPDLPPLRILFNKKGKHVARDERLVHAMSEVNYRVPSSSRRPHI